ncbi:MAG: hypothetical protein U0325_30105 [Polyangiales bacterium]
MATPRPWTVLEHGPLEKLTENVWTVDGALPNMALRRRMTLVRLRDGALLVHNAIALSEGLMADIERWGEPAHVVVPNGFHRMDAHAWKSRYPRSRVWCPSPACKKVDEMVATDGGYELLPTREELAVEYLEGCRAAFAEGVFLARARDGRMVLIFNDALFNHPDVGGFGGAMMKVMGSTGGRPARDAAVRGGRGRRPLRRAAPPPREPRGDVHLIPGHGVPVDLDAGGVLRDVADRLSPL